MRPWGSSDGTSGIGPRDEGRGRERVVVPEKRGGGPGVVCRHSRPRGLPRGRHGADRCHFRARGRFRPETRHADRRFFSRGRARPARERRAHAHSRREEQGCWRGGSGGGGSSHDGVGFCFPGGCDCKGAEERGAAQAGDGTSTRPALNPAHARWRGYGSEGVCGAASGRSSPHPSAPDRAPRSDRRALPPRALRRPPSSPQLQQFGP